MPAPGVPLAGTVGGLCPCCDDLEEVRTTGSPISKAYTCSWSLSPATKVKEKESKEKLSTMN